MDGCCRVRMAYTTARTRDMTSSPCRANARLGPAPTRSSNWCALATTRATWPTGGPFGLDPRSESASRRSRPTEMTKSNTSSTDHPHEVSPQIWVRTNWYNTFPLALATSNPVSRTTGSGSDTISASEATTCATSSTSVRSVRSSPSSSFSVDIIHSSKKSPVRALDACSAAAPHMDRSDSVAEVAVAPAAGSLLSSSESE